MPEVRFLHGELLVEIDRAKDLYNRENLGVPVLGRAIAKIANMKVNAYVNIKLDGIKRGSTAPAESSTSPDFKETFNFKVCHSLDESNDFLALEVKDRNAAGSVLLGDCHIPFSTVCGSANATLSPTEGFDLICPGKGRKGKLYVTVKYTPYDASEPTCAAPAVPAVYFPPQPGNAVRLYQSAHNGPDTVPPYTMPSGAPFVVHGCWADIATAIEGAQKFIYMAGWSVQPLLRLVRHSPEGGGGETGGKCLGEMLKAASERGVTVKMLVWDDISSVNVPVLLQKYFKGVMGTHDEELRDWMAANAPLVQCKLVGRSGGEGNSLIEGQVVSAAYSHHQKAVVCDFAAPAGSGREMVAFVGGIDLTNGRYDTAQHHLYRTEDGRFDDDFEQGSFDTKNGGGRPRQPWQDIHCRIHGAGAFDVAMNFTERWMKQVDDSIAAPVELGCTPPDEVPCSGSPFTVQLLRSMDSRSATLDEEHRSAALFFKKGRAVDRSIYLAYIHHIRRARHFVYIENQYFLGSCFDWSAARDCGCSHAVPAELVQKIVTKIRARERFAAYIVLPLFPEGDPASDAVQAILRFQGLTMEAMFRRIAVELAAVGSDAAPTDYLNFFCLGNRAAGPPGEGPEEGAPGGNRPGEASRRNRRFMIYVHSKFMVVDDEVAIIGSANVNMRSLAGTRDTELAVALWQPEHVDLRASPADAADEAVEGPRGEVHGFRMSVWREHLAHCDDADVPLLQEPSSLNCVQRVQALAEENWNLFIGAENVNMLGHLMTYPVQCEDAGRGSLSSRVACVPDFPNATMLGRSTNLPNVLTT